MENNKDVTKMILSTNKIMDNVKNEIDLNRQKINSLNETKIREEEISALNIFIEFFKELHSLDFANPVNKKELEEDVRYQIERNILLCQAQILNSAKDKIRNFSNLLNLFSNNYEITPKEETRTLGEIKSNINILNSKLEQKNQLLNIISKKEALIETFVRSKNIEFFQSLGIAFFFHGMSYMFVAMLSVIILSSFGIAGLKIIFTFFGTMIFGGTLGAIKYHNLNKGYQEVIDKVNKELGNDAIPSFSKENIEILKIDLEKVLKEVMEDICKIRLQLAQEKSILEDINSKSTSSEVSKDKNIVLEETSINKQEKGVRLDNLMRIRIPKKPQY